MKISEEIRGDSSSSSSDRALEDDGRDYGYDDDPLYKVDDKKV